MKFLNIFESVKNNKDVIKLTEEENPYMNMHDINRVKSDAKNGVVLAKSAWFKRDKDGAEKYFGYSRVEPNKQNESKKDDKKNIKGTMQQQEEPDIDPEDYNVENGEDTNKKGNDDGMEEVKDDELIQLVDATSTMSKTDSQAIKAKIEVMELQKDNLEKSAKKLADKQKGTKKDSRGNVLSQLYTKIDSLEKKIATLKKRLEESNKKKKDTLMLCNECFKTFRSNTNECTKCKSKNVENIVEDNNDDLDSKKSSGEKKNNETNGLGIEIPDEILDSIELYVQAIEANEIEGEVNINSAVDFVHSISTSEQVEWIKDNRDTLKNEFIERGLEESKIREGKDDKKIEKSYNDLIDKGISIEDAITTVADNYSLDLVDVKNSLKGSGIDV